MELNVQRRRHDAPHTFDRASLQMAEEAQEPCRRPLYWNMLNMPSSVPNGDTCKSKIGTIGFGDHHDLVMKQESLKTYCNVNNWIPSHCEINYIVSGYQPYIVILSLRTREYCNVVHSTTYITTQLRMLQQFIGLQWLFTRLSIATQNSVIGSKDRNMCFQLLGCHHISVSDWQNSSADMCSVEDTHVPSWSSVQSFHVFETQQGTKIMACL